MLMAKLITREMLANLGHCGSFRWTILDAIPPSYSSIFDSSGYDARGACLSRLVSFFLFFLPYSKNIKRSQENIHKQKKTT